MNLTNIKSAGINYEEGLQRFANQPALYQKYLIKFFDDPTFARLETELAAKEYGKAFQSAHTLKGMTGNLSMTDFYENICVLVEALRSNQTEATDAMYQQLIPLYNQMRQAIV